MPLRDATLEYWKAATHLRSLPTQADREAYCLAILVTKRDAAPEQARRQLLTKLIDSVLQEAA